MLLISAVIATLLGELFYYLVTVKPIFKTELYHYHYQEIVAEYMTYEMCIMYG